MPCYTRQTSTVALHVSDQALLKKALDSLGWRHTFTKTQAHTWDKQGNKLTFTFGTQEATVQKGQEEMVKKVQVAYGVQVTKAAFAHFGWQLTPAKSKAAAPAQQRQLGG